MTHGLQEGAEGAGLVQSGKEKSKGNPIADYIYLKVVTRITEPHSRSKRYKGQQGEAAPWKVHIRKYREGG